MTAAELIAHLQAMPDEHKRAVRPPWPPHLDTWRGSWALDAPLGVTDRERLRQAWLTSDERAVERERSGRLSLRARGLAGRAPDAA